MIDEWFDTPNISFDDLQLPIGLSVAFHGAIASELAIAHRIVELKQKIDFEKSQFKKHMAKLSVQDVKNFKIMLHELKEAFLKKRAEAQGSRERMKVLADKSVQAYNEAEKRKALGRPGIDPRMAAKQQQSVLGWCVAKAALLSRAWRCMTNLTNLQTAHCLQEVQ